MVFPPPKKGSFRLDLAAGEGNKTKYIISGYKKFEIVKFIAFVSCVFFPFLPFLGERGREGWLDAWMDVHGCSWNLLCN